MAKYATLKAAVEAAIKTNGAQQITGQVLQTQLVNMITSLGKYFQSFGGLATPAGSFSAGDESVTFLAVEAGTYTNFGGAVLDGKTLHVLAYDGDWADVDTSIPSGAAFEAALALAIKGSQSGIAEGIADTISAGTAQEFLQRQSGGDGVNCLKRIKGKTIAWNQMITKISADFTFDGTEKARGSIGLNSSNTIKTIVGHKYLMVASVKTTFTGAITWKERFSSSGVEGTQTLTGNGVVATIGTCASVQTVPLSIFNDAAITPANGDTLTLTLHDCFDLTLMFGAGNEPSTVAEFEALYPELNYAFNAGVLKSNDAKALVTDGFNQWDGEKTDNKAIIVATDSVTNLSGYFYTDYIPVIGGQTYYFSKTFAMGSNSYGITYYDANKTYIGGVAVTADNVGFTKVIPAGTAFIRASGILSLVSQGIINLSWSGYRNGEYEPYWQRVLALRISELTGIPEGGTEADRVTMFPNGAGGTGSAFDSIFVENGVTKARKTMLPEVDLGDFDYEYDTVNSRFYTQVAGIKMGNVSREVPLICSKYIGIYDKRPIADVPDKACYTEAGTIYVYIKDTAYTDAATFKAAMSGVKLIAEAATPIVYTDLQYADGTPFTMPATILVDNYGTERIQAPEGATTPSAPFCCDSNYSIGVANLVKRLAALENAE